jgi:hypothetical protein
VIICVVASANPAPTMPTLGASHMVASINLFCAEATFWALYHPMEDHIVS